MRCGCESACVQRYVLTRPNAEPIETAMCNGCAQLRSDRETVSLVVLLPQY
jgi:hypothetical protein